MGNKSAKRTSGFLGTSALTRPLFALGAATALFGAGPAHAIDANTLPQNPNVVGGKDSFAQSGNTLNVNQSTKRTVIDWRSFDIGSKAQVNFNQPGTSAIAVNRVNSSANPTQIEGGLHANGQVWILNPNGVFFGKTAHVDAAGIVASTANIDTNAFMAGSNKLQMTGADHGAVENQGNISVGQAGLAAFVAPSVRNSGTINATVGKVALAAGTTYTLDLAGDHLVELGLGSVKAVVDNSGKIVNPGGTIALTAKAASQVVSSVVNVSGTVSASSVTNSGGTITLGGDNVTTTSTAQLSADAGTNGNGGTITSVANNQGNYAGSFSAKGGSQSGNGGKVETSGKTVVIDPKAKIVASAAHGANGQWLLDPVDLNIISGSDDGVVSGSSVTNGTIQDTLNNNTDLTLSTSQGGGGNGDISLQTAINATGTGALTLTGRHLSAANSSDVINIGGTLTLNVNTVNNTANPTGSWISDALGMVGTVNGGTTINLGAGTYAITSAITLNKANTTLAGVNGTVLTDSGTGAAISVAASGVTVKDFELDILPSSGALTGVDITSGSNGANITGLTIRGDVPDTNGDSYITYYADGGPTRPSSTGIVVEPGTGTNGTTGLSITGNDIRNVRTGIRVAGANYSNPSTPNDTGAVSGNTIDNTKGGIIVQWNDGTGLTISGNKQGTFGNEWGIVLNSNTPNNKSTAEPGAEQTYLLGLSNANGDTTNGHLSVLDRFYGSDNRTEVTVNAASTATAANDASGYNGNGLGSARQPLSTIQAGVNAVVAGGTVNVLGGDYTLSTELDITKSLSLLGAGVGVTNITSTSTGYGIFVDANKVTLDGFTYTGPTAHTSSTYGIKVQPNPTDPAGASARLTDFIIGNVTINGGYHTGLDLNGVDRATIDNVNVSGITWGNGIGLTDSADITITNSTTTGNAWGGLALYQTNYTYNQQTNNITVDGTNTFNDGIYAQDQSDGIGDPANGHYPQVSAPGLDFGTINLTGQGIEYVGTLNTGGTDGTYTFFQKTEQGAIDATTAFNTRYGSTAGTVQGYDETSESVNGNNTFYVGYNTGNTAALSINAAVNAAAAGATINVDPGTYNESVTIATSGITLEGVDAANRSAITGGILMSGTLSDVSLENISVSGTAYADFVIADSGTLTNFTMDNVLVDGGSVAGRYGVGNGQIGGAISITNSEFDNILGWAVFDNRAGAGSTAGVNDGTVLTSVNFSDNIIDNSQGSIAFRQLGNGGPYVDVTISGNTVENVGNSTDSFGGIFKVFNAGTVTFSDNNVSGIGTSGFNPAGEAAYGAALLTRGVSTLNVTGNTFTDNNMVFAVEPGKSLPGTTTFKDNTFTNNAYSIYLPTNVSGSGTINFTGTNNFVSGANTVKDIVWTSPSALDLTNVEFNGVLGSAMTNDQLFAAEDLITDGLDNTAYGLARLKAGNVYVTAANGFVQNGVTEASSGDTVNVQAGNYTLSGELDITKSLSLVGAGIGSTNITSNSTGYGIYVTADDVSLSGFTYNAPTAVGATYGIKVEPGTNVASDRVTDFNIDHVTINGGYRTGLDLNGVDGATIDNVSVSNVVHGNGIGLTDSANVTLTNDTTANNAWGGLALYQTNTYYDQQVNNIVVDGTNTFNDTIPVYTEDQSASQNFGSISLAGFSYVVQSPNAANDVYSWFQKTKQAAFDFATNASLSNGNVNVPTATVQGYGGSGAYGNNVFYVGTGSNSDAMSIDNAVDQATTGGTVNVDAGTYAEDVAVGTQLSFNFGGSGVTVNSLTVGSGGAGSTLGGSLTATGAIALNGATTVNGNLKAASFASNATLAMTGNLTTSGAASLGGASTVKGNVQAASFTSNGTLALTGDLTTSGAAALNGASSVTGNVSADSLTTGSTLALVGDITATNGVTLGGASTVTGNISAASLTASNTLGLTGNLTTSGASALNGASTITGNVQADTLSTGGTLTQVGNIAATNGVTLGAASSVTGNVSAKTFTSNGTLALNGGLTASGAAQFNGATTVNGNVQAGSITAGNSFGLTGNATATGAIALNGANTLAGTLTGGSIALGATTLTGSTSLNTSGSNGAIQVASVDGGQALSLNAGTGAILLGNVGATTALASLTDASATTLTGSTYNAGSFLFGGDVTLTAATTTLSTGGGDITFTGDIFGTADSAQSLTLNAGPGTGSPSANGNITLDNAGTSAVWLGDVTVSGNNFTANTVYVGGNYTSTLTGNQVFAADTLHTRGNVDSTVGGDASGHIDAAGDVNISAGGDVSGTIGGNNVTLTGDDVNANVTAQSNASVTGNTVEGNYAANTVGIVAQNNVNAAVNATNFQLVAASGSVNGTWTNYTVGGSGTVYLNGDPQIGVNPSQLVVEGFTLPAGTTIGANGQLILPQGVLLGLLSPGGGKPKMILVHTVQELGQLLADGYSVIVIDLSGNDKDKPIQLASN